MRTILFLLMISGMARAEWPQFRGPTGDGHATAKGVPTEWSATQNVAWRVEIPGQGWSSPVLAKGRVYLTTAVVADGKDADDAKADRSLRALCLEAATGKTLWNVEVFPQDGATAPGSIHSKNGHASPTPIVTDDALYVHFGHQGTAALDLDGKIRWQNRTLTYDPQHGGGASPILVDGMLIFSCDARTEPFIAALKARDGALGWKFPRPTNANRKFAFATSTAITVGGKTQIISPGADLVNALEPTTGKEIWHARFEGYSIVPKPVYGSGLVFISSSFDSPEVLAIDPTGTGDVTDTHVKWIETKYAPKTPSMIHADGLLYLVADSGAVACREAQSGALVWESKRTLKDCSASPILCDNKLYVLDEHGTCAVYATGREEKIIATNMLPGQRTLASMAVADGVIFLRTETSLFALGSPR
jgi:outer membrane protein assembly factor BamB